MNKMYIIFTLMKIQRLLYYYFLYYYYHFQLGVRFEGFGLIDVSLSEVWVPGGNVPSSVMCGKFALVGKYILVGFVTGLLVSVLPTKVYSMAVPTTVQPINAPGIFPERNILSYSVFKYGKNSMVE